jgi:hypothetical protein
MFRHLWIAIYQGRRAQYIAAAYVEFIERAASVTVRARALGQVHVLTGQSHTLTPIHHSITHTLTPRHFHHFVVFDVPIPAVTRVTQVFIFNPDTA